MLKVIHTVPTINNEASGPSYSVVGLCESLLEKKVDISLAVLDTGTDLSSHDYIKSFPFSGSPRKIGRSKEMKDWLRFSALNNDVDIFHNHSLWMMPNVYPEMAVRGTNTPLVTSPRGTLSNWALNHSRYTKEIFKLAYQSKALNRTDCFHATAEHEYHDIRQAGYNQPVAVIPNGINLPNLIKLEKNKSGLKRLLFLGRIHQVKGIDILLNAWARVYTDYQDWELVITGPDNGGYLKKMQELAKDLNLKRVTFTGPVYGLEKQIAYQKANLFILPSRSENFGMSIAESLSSGVPVITTKETPWAGLKLHNAGWWIDLSTESLVNTLDVALSQDTAQLHDMGIVGRQWMSDEYSWESVSHMMLETYQWITSNGDIPDHVIV